MIKGKLFSVRQEARESTLRLTIPRWRIFFAIDERNFEIFYDDLKGEHACTSVFVQE